MEQGLMMLSQEAILVGDVSYHEYNGILVDDEERALIGRNLGPKNKVMFLRNHGVVVCASTVEEAWRLAVLVVDACEKQVLYRSVYPKLSSDDVLCLIFYFIQKMFIPS